MSHRTDPATELAIIAAYQACATRIQVGARYGVSDATVGNIVRRHGLACRTMEECHRVYACDHHYFDAIDTEAKAYWLGFLAADGCVHDDGAVRLTLAARDVDHVHAFRAALGSAHPVTRGASVSPHGVRHDNATLSIVSQTLSAALIRLNVVPRKSLVLRAPELPAAMMRHYWRGLFDGNGCVTMAKKSHAWAAGLVGSHAIVETFATWARAVTDSQAAVYRVKKISSFKVTGGHMAWLLLDAMYAGATVSLERKRLLYEQLCAERASSVPYGRRWRRTVTL